MPDYAALGVRPFLAALRSSASSKAHRTFTPMRAGRHRASGARRP